jgi:hypothetical protein
MTEARKQIAAITKNLDMGDGAEDSALVSGIIKSFPPAYGQSRSAEKVNEIVTWLEELKVGLNKNANRTLSRNSPAVAATAKPFTPLPPSG